MDRGWKFYLFLCKIIVPHRPAPTAPSHRPGRPSPEDPATDQPRPPPGKAWHRPAKVEVEVEVEHQPASPQATAALRPPPDDPPTGTARPKPPPRQPPPGRPRLALNLILAKTSPQTNLNLPQEKHGTAQLRLRLRLRTSLRHPVPRPLCDRLLTTHRPALLAPSHHPGSHRQEDPAWPSTSSSQRPRHRPTSTSPRKSMAPPS